MMKRCLFLLLVIFLVSCGKKKTATGILKPDKMQAVLWDVLRADAFTESYQKKDSTKNAAESNVQLQQQVFLIHHTSKEEFYNSYAYYKRHPEQMKAILDSIISKASRERTQLQPAKPLRHLIQDTTAVLKIK